MFISLRNRIFCGLAAIAMSASSACTSNGDSSTSCSADTECHGERICHDGRCIDPLAGTGGGSAASTCFELRGTLVCVQRSDPGFNPDSMGVAKVPSPPGDAPASASLDMTGFVVADQGGCGSCAAFATKDAMGARATVDKGVFLDFSAADIWYIAGYGAANCLDGSSIATIFAQAISKATYVVDSSVWPYDPLMPVSSLKDVPPPATLEQGGLAYIRQAAGIGPRNIKDMKNAIASGWPAVIGVDFYQSSGWGRPDGRIDLPQAGAPREGGHAVMLTSYDDTTQTFGFVNSWGTAFGKSGYGTLTYAFLQQYSTGGMALESLAFKGNGCPTDYCSTSKLKPGNYCNGAQLITCGVVSGCTTVTGQTTCPGGCSNGHCAGAMTCGDGIKDQSEQCDGADLGGATCQSQGFNHGSLSCNAGACTLNTSGCCTNQCSQQGKTQCAGPSTVQTCLPNALGCLVWGSDASCPNGCDAASGQCKGANPCSGVICNNPPNQQCYNSVGSCSGGACSYTPKAYGSPCSDGNACTSSDVCDGNGSCAGSPMSCNTPPNSVCYNSSGSCSGGSCFYTPSPSGTPCDDGNPNTANDQCDGNGKCNGVCIPTVTNVSPLNATLNQSTSFTITGSCMPPTIAPFISQCANLQVTGTGPSLATFQCTPSFSSGIMSGLVKDKPGGNVLKNFSVNVQPCTPVVNSVTPTNVSLNHPTTFTITGSCLPSTIAAFISQCANLQMTSAGPNQATFQCTPSYSTGVQTGVVKDKPGGNVLKNFTVSVN